MKEQLESILSTHAVSALVVFAVRTLGERFDFDGRACFPAEIGKLSSELAVGPTNVFAVSENYVSEVLIVLKTVLIAEATLLTPLTQTRAIKATNKAYSTRS